MGSMVLTHDGDAIISEIYIAVPPERIFPMQAFVEKGETVETRPSAAAG